jgi:hypothetical protein
VLRSGAEGRRDEKTNFDRRLSQQEILIELPEVYSTVLTLPSLSDL